MGFCGKKKQTINCYTNNRHQKLTACCLVYKATKVLPLKFKIFMNFSLLRVDAGEVPGECFHPSLRLHQWRKILQAKETTGCLQRARRCLFCRALCSLLQVPGLQSWALSAVPVDGTPEWVTASLGALQAWLCAANVLHRQPLTVVSESRCLEKEEKGLMPSQGENISQLGHMLERCTICSLSTPKLF